MWARLPQIPTVLGLKAPFRGGKPQHGGGLREGTMRRPDHSRDWSTGQTSGRLGQCSAR